MGRRFAAALLDGLVLLAVALPALLADGTLRSALIGTGVVLVVAAVVLQWVWHGTRGWTLGRLALGLRTVDAETLHPIGVARVLVRGLVVAAGLLVVVIGAVVVLLSPLFDATGRRRGWHDKAAGDEVIDLRAEQPEAPSRWFEETAGDVRLPSAPVPQARPRTQPSSPAPGAATPPWVTGALPVATVTGSTGSLPLVLAPLSPREHGPDVDTRTMPVVRVSAARLAPAVAVVTAPPVPEPSQVVHVGLDPELEMTRRAAPRPEAAVAVPVDEPSTTAELAMSDGRRVVIEGVALVGRNPSAAVDVQLVRVVDPGRSVSKTHLQVAVSASGVWVADRGSTNGTVVTLPDGGQVVCPVDHPVRLRAGSTVRFGDCSFVVVRGPATPST
jgi:uncharacterized RDD family membrane protein YckC